MKKELGKITEVKFGLGGYQDCQLGLQLAFESGEGGCVGTIIGFWDKNRIECTERSQWSEQNRDEHYAVIMRTVSDLLSQAKVDSVDKLKGKPVELTMEGNTLKDWRILTEVI